jgi:small subunit ribosomal protein S5
MVMAPFGMGKGKSKEVPAAVQKAMEEARRNMTKVALKNGSIHHKVMGQHGAASVMMAPCSQGYRHHCWRSDARSV